MWKGKRRRHTYRHDHNFFPSVCSQTTFGFSSLYSSVLLTKLLLFCKTNSACYWYYRHGDRQPMYDLLSDLLLIPSVGLEGGPVVPYMGPWTRLIPSKLLQDWLWSCGVFTPKLLFFLPGLGRALSNSVCAERRILAGITTLTWVQLWERGILCVQYDRPEREVHPWVYCLILNPFSLRNATQNNQTTIHHKHNAMHVVLRNSYYGMIWPLSALFWTVLA